MSYARGINLIYEAVGEAVGDAVEDAVGVVVEDAVAERAVHSIQA